MSTEKIIVYKREKVYLSTLTQDEVKHIAKAIKKNFEFTNHLTYCVVKNKLSKLSTHIGGYTFNGGFNQDRHAYRHLFAHVEGLYLSTIKKEFKYMKSPNQNIMDVRKGYVHELCYDVMELACGFKPVKHEAYREQLISNWR
jgi:hypothetical protein